MVSCSVVEVGGIQIVRLGPLKVVGVLLIIVGSVATRALRPRNGEPVRGSVVDYDHLLVCGAYIEFSNIY